MSDYVENIRHVLNTELMQFTLGKTQKTINSIKQSQQEWIEYLQINDDTIPGTCIIPIILTNNSLVETEQWTIRLEKELGGGIVIVSSKGTADYSNSSELINYMKECEINDLPSVIIMCTNGTRIKTCKEIFKAFSNLSHSPRQDIIIRFDPAFDEIDKQTGLLKVFLKDLSKKKYMTSNDECELINKILYITATPNKQLFNTIRRFGVPDFTNLDTDLEKDYPRPKHEDLVRAYKSMKDDAIMYHASLSNPVNYVKEILDSGSINLDQKRIIFAPAEIKVSSHEEMTTIFTNLGFTVLQHNGKFKGFVEPNGSRVPLEVFNEQNFHQEKAQMMDTLRKWNESYPSKSLAITGYNTIERGVTFNTDGFNFTEVIISSYHAKQINKLLQLIGRDHGHADYCKPCVVYTTEEIHKSVGKYIENFHKLKEADVERYNITDFSKSPSTIPVKITIINDELLTEIMDLLKSYSFKKGRLSRVETEKKTVAYKRIHEIFKEYQSNQEYILWVDYNNRNKIDISERYIKTIRRYDGGEKSSRRFEMFSNNHDNRKSSSQKGESDNYSLDVACKDFVDGSFVNHTNVMWLTYRIED
tara:strand:- start:877 stop:2640 length:1764 start_codon:yes stop_codon:yes gene_type:complete